MAKKVKPLLPIIIDCCVILLIGYAIGKRKKMDVELYDE